LHLPEHFPEMLLITCGETANGVYIGRFTTLEISTSGHIFIYRGVNTHETTLSREYLSTKYFFERNMALGVIVLRGQHVPKQSWIDTTKLMQAEKTLQPSEMKNFVNAAKWFLEGRFGLELFARDFNNEHSISHGVFSNGFIKMGSKKLYDQIKDSSSKFDTCFDDTAYNFFDYEQTFLVSKLNKGFSFYARVRPDQSQFHRYYTTNIKEITVEYSGI